MRSREDAIDATAYAPTRRDGPGTNETAQNHRKTATSRDDGVRGRWRRAGVRKREVPLRVALRLLREALLELLLEELLAGLGLADHLDRAVAEPA